MNTYQIIIYQATLAHTALKSGKRDDSSRCSSPYTEVASTGTHTLLSRHAARSRANVLCQNRDCYNDYQDDTNKHSYHQGCAELQNYR